MLPKANTQCWPQPPLSWAMASPPPTISRMAHPWASHKGTQQPVSCGLPTYRLCFRFMRSRNFSIYRSHLSRVSVCLPASCSAATTPQKKISNSFPLTQTLVQRVHAPHGYWPLQKAHLFCKVRIHISCTHVHIFSKGLLCPFGLGWATYPLSNIYWLRCLFCFSIF